MSKCLSCKYALYDGMCLTKGKFTLLDALACELYQPTFEAEAGARAERSETIARSGANKS